MLEGSDSVDGTQLPDYDLVVGEECLSIVNIVLSDDRIVRSYTESVIDFGLDRRGSVRGVLWEVPSSVVDGYMPSRVWYDPNVSTYRMTFYVGGGLPDSVRPFKGGSMYIFEALPVEGEVMTYDKELSMFVDHVPNSSTPIGVAYLFVFPESMLDKFVVN